jgi:hypothetical protein
VSLAPYLMPVTPSPSPNKPYGTVAAETALQLERDHVLNTRSRTITLSPIRFSDTTRQTDTNRYQQNLQAYCDVFVQQKGNGQTLAIDQVETPLPEKKQDYVHRTFLNTALARTPERKLRLRVGATIPWLNTHIAKKLFPLQKTAENFRKLFDADQDGRYSRRELAVLLATTDHIYEKSIHRLDEAFEASNDTHTLATALNGQWHSVVQLGIHNPEDFKTLSGNGKIEYAESNLLHLLSMQKGGLQFLKPIVAQVSEEILAVPQRN